MLVLTRKEGEAVIIGDDIAVTITRIRGDKVRIGIEAPTDIKVRRAELDAITTGGEMQPAILSSP